MELTDAEVSRELVVAVPKDEAVAIINLLASTLLVMVVNPAAYPLDC